ncbi:MAG: patatin-like phospholipase family protein [Chitinophagaceae bacterium]
MNFKLSTEPDNKYTISMLLVRPYLSMILRFCILILAFFLHINSFAQNLSRPKIGLTLSGGGAKGLAHIGILKAIDSAGLKIDYITGTSMGSIIGGLYAIGYSADSIEKMAQATDWDLLLSNQSSLRSMIMEEKDEYGKYAIELPWMNYTFRLPSGVLESQELWLRLAELFAPVANVKDFSQFSIPFKCIGTDISNGEAVVMSKGEVVTAIRSSMAIPSVFTAIEYNGSKLVDGGVVRNFPVRDVKEMGADFIIGSNVAADLFPSGKLLNGFQILLQVAFFREAEDRKNEVPLCNIYVPIPMEKFTMASFSQANELIQIGLEEGRKLYPHLKKVSDSLDAIYGKRELVKNRLPKPNTAKISSYDITGLEHTTADFFVHTIDLTTNKYYSALELSGMVRKAFGTRYYSRINYSLVPQADGSTKIVFDVTENPLTFSKLGLHYNEFSGISIVANLTSRNFILPNSRDLVTVNIGENFRLRGEHLQYIGRLKNFALILGTQFEQFEIPTYNDLKQDGAYKTKYFNVDGRFQFSTRRHLTVGFGTRFEWIKFKPSITSRLELNGKNNFSTSYVFLNHNSLDRSVYPKKGVRLKAEADLVFQQYPNIVFSLNGQPLHNGDSAGIRYGRYNRTMLNLESFTPLSNRTVLMLQLQSGINFKYKQRIMNEFSIGGLTPLFRNQVTFAGLDEGTFYSTSVAAFQAGLRYQLFNNTYLIGRANALFNNLNGKSAFYTNPDFLSGYSLTFAYNFALGPLELSAMYLDQSKKVRTYINIGIPF